MQNGKRQKGQGGGGEGQKREREGVKESECVRGENVSCFVAADACQVAFGFLAIATK